MELIVASRVSILVLASCAAALAQEGDATGIGNAVYQKHCAQCHDKGVGRAPQLLTLGLSTPERVLAALTTGKMAEQGKAFTAAESRAVAMFVTGKTFGADEAPKQGVCAEPAPAFDKPFAGAYWNGWGVDAANRRMQPAAMAGLRADQVPQLKLK